jgi:hypothetical protein
MANAETLSTLWSEAGAMPVCTLLGVKSLFESNAMVEVEVTAIA